MGNACRRGGSLVGCMTSHDVYMKTIDLGMDPTPSATLKKRVENRVAKLKKQIAIKQDKIEKYDGQLRETIRTEMQSLINEKNKAEQLIMLIDSGVDLPSDDESVDSDGMPMPHTSAFRDLIGKD